MAKKKAPIGLKQQTEELRLAMLKAFDEYSDASKEMAAFEGKVIDEVGLDKVNATIANVQDKFAQLWHALNFIQIYHQFSTNALNSHADFIDRLKQAGAVEEHRS